MISDEAVEVLASRDWAKDAERSEHEFPSWEEAARDNEWAGLVKEYRDDARTILEAAAPFIAAETWDTAIKLASEVAWEHDASACSAVSQITNPYRSQA